MLTASAVRKLPSSCFTFVLWVFCMWVVACLSYHSLSSSHTTLRYRNKRLKSLSDESENTFKNQVRRVCLNDKDFEIQLHVRSWETKLCNPCCFCFAFKKSTFTPKESKRENAKDDIISTATSSYHSTHRMVVARILREKKKMELDATIQLLDSRNKETYRLYFTFYWGGWSGPGTRVVWQPYNAFFRMINTLYLLLSLSASSRIHRCPRPSIELHADIRQGGALISLEYPP